MKIYVQFFPNFIKVGLQMSKILKKFVPILLIFFFLCCVISCAPEAELPSSEASSPSSSAQAENQTSQGDTGTGTIPNNTSGSSTGTSGNSSTETSAGTPDNSQSSSEPLPPEAEGFFIDAPAMGLCYSAYPSGFCGVTDINGRFRYRVGDSITFSLCGMQLGYPVPAARCITPLSLVHAVSLYGTSAETVLARNIVRFLMAMNTGINPFGMVLPTTFGIWTGNIMQIFSSADFDALIVEVIASLRGVLPSEVILPTIEQAQKHFTISQSLISQLEANAAKNLFISIRVPQSFKNHYIDIAYNADKYPNGISSYNSGAKVLVSNGAIAGYSASLHEANWQLTFTAMQDNSHITIGDVISFYTADGFSAAPAQGYPLEITQSNRLLFADLTLDSDAGIVSEVHSFSGTIKVPKMFPDGTALADTAMSECKLFVDVLDTDGNRAGSFMLILPVTGNSNWIEKLNGEECEAGAGNEWIIPFTTALAAGNRYKIQLYYKPDTSKRWYVKQSITQDSVFDADCNDIDYSFSSWMM